MEETLREKLAAQALYLTDRFSPGYGDMPLAQSGQICEVLERRTLHRADGQPKLGF